MFTEENLYKNVVDIIKKEITSVAFSTWFDTMNFVEVENNTAILSVPLDYTKNIIIKRYNDLLKDSLYKCSDGIIKEYKIIVKESDMPSFLDSIDFNEDSCLNRRYTFENFIIGESNRFAHAASIAVSENPAESYNPLFLYGGVGLGKTHLLHAIGNRIKQRDRTKRILYTSSETFTNEFIDSIKSGQNNAFRDKFRNIDVLMIDDVQFFGGKEKVQEEFFHTFNHLFHNNKQIILSSDRPPKDISTLEERIKTRLECGLMCDINAPDLETRIAILKKKTEEENVVISDEIIEYIASKIRSNVRELEGIFTRLVALTKLSDENITKELVESVIKIIIKDQKKVLPQIETVIVETASYFNIDPRLLKTNSKKKEIVTARQICMYIARIYLNMSLPKIGEEFGGKDHTTVMHSIKKITECIKVDSYIKTVVNEVYETIREK